MTIAEAITTIDSLKHNTYSPDDKVKWLSLLDAKVKSKIIDVHESKEPFSFHGYDSATKKETELLVPAPYDEMYLRWMEAMIDYHNNDLDRYNNAIILFDNAYEDYKRHYTRTHMPISKGNQFIF